MLLHDQTGGVRGTWLGVSAWLIWLLGCGDRSLGGPPDGLVPVTITVATGTIVPYASGGEPLADLQVVFVSPDDTLVSSHRTDANGQVFAMVEPGSSFTLVGTNQLETSLMTYLDVQAGEIFIGGHTRLDDSRIPMQMVFAPRPGSVIARFGGYHEAEVLLGYSSGTAPLEVGMPFQNRVFDVALVASDADGSWAAATANGVVATPGGTIQFGPWQPLAPLQLELTGIGADEQVRIWASFLDEGCPMVPLYPPVPEQGSMTPPPSYSGTTPIPPNGDGIWVVVWVERADGGEWHLYRVPPGTPRFELHAPTVAMPRVVDVAYDPITRDVTWNEVPLGGGNPSIVLVQLEYLPGPVRWNIFGPRSTERRVHVPDLAALNPHAPLSAVSAWMYMYDVPGGYDAIRQDPSSLGFEWGTVDPNATPHAEYHLSFGPDR